MWDAVHTGFVGGSVSLAATKSGERGPPVNTQSCQLVAHCSAAHLVRMGSARSRDQQNVRLQHLLAHSRALVGRVLAGPGRAVSLRAVCQRLTSRAQKRLGNAGATLAAFPGHLRPMRVDDTSICFLIATL